MTRQARWWIVVILAALLASGCATDSHEQLNPPNVRIYRPPQIWITPAPTKVAIDLAATQASVTAEPAAVIVPPGPTLDYEQYLVDEIDYLLDKIERKLNSTDVNP